MDCKEHSEMEESQPFLPKQSVSAVPKRTLRHYIVYVTLIGFCLGSGMNMYLVNEWIQHELTKATFGNGIFAKNISTCHDTINHSDKNYQSYVYVQQETARWQMYYSIASSVPSLFANTILPSYTDSIGRKFLIGASVLAMLINYVVSFVTMKFNLNFIYIVVGGAIGGLAGGSSGFSTACFAFLADITHTQKERTTFFAVLDGIVMICFTVAGLVTGIYIKCCHYIYPMLTVVGLLVFAFLTVCITPETVVKSKRHSAPGMTENIKRIAVFYTSSTFKDKRRAYITLLAAFLLSNISTVQRSNVETTYQLGKPLCWQSTTIGYFTSLRHLGQGVIGIGSIRFFQRCLSDGVIAMGSALSNAGSFVLEAFAFTDIMMFMVPVLAVFSFMVNPLIRSMMSMLTPADQQGAMLSGLAIMETVSSLGSNLISNNIYAATVSFMPGFVFLVLAGLNILVFLLLGTYVASRKKEGSHTTKLN